MERIKPFASKLSIRTGVSGSLTQALLDHELDMLVTSEPMEDHPELHRYPILRDPFVMIVPDSYCRERDVTPQWLAQNVPFVHYARQHRIGNLIDLIARRLNIELLTHYELDSTQTLLRFVQAGHGWAIVTGLCLIRHPDLLGETKIMPLVDGAAGLSVVIYPDGPLSKDGLTLDVEIFEDGSWQLYSRNRLSP